MLPAHDKKIWTEFLDFRIGECLGLWSEAIIEFPFGRMIVLHPDDAPCLLMSADLTAAPPSEVVTATEDMTGKLGLAGAFLLSSAWEPDRRAFEAHLRTRGYKPVFDQHWMIKEDLGGSDAIPDSDFEIDEAPDSATVKDLYRRTLGASDALSERLKRRLDRGGGPVTVGFVVARTMEGDPVACGGYSYAGHIAYFHCLGTLDGYRRFGIARHMAKVRYEMMRKAGVSYIVGAVARGNAPSFEMQRALGYRVLETTSMWRKV